MLLCRLWSLTAAYMKAQYHAACLGTMTHSSQSTKLLLRTEAPAMMPNGLDIPFSFPQDKFVTVRQAATSRLIKIQHSTTRGLLGRHNSLWP